MAANELRDFLWSLITGRPAIMTLDTNAKGARMRSVLLLSLLLTSIVTRTAQSEVKLSTTLVVEFEEDRTAGILVRCHLAFVMLARDFVERDGAIVRVNGSVGLVLVNPKSLALWVRVFTADTTKQADGTISVRPFKPAYAYATIGGRSTAQREVVRDICPTEGYCAGFADANLLGATASLPFDRRLTISFLRSPGSMDVVNPIEFGLEGTPERRALDGYAACTSQLLGQLKATLR